MAKTIKQRDSITKQFSEIAIGGHIFFETTDRTRPYSFARQAGIKIETELKKHLEGGVMRFKVTRIPDPDKTK